MYGCAGWHGERAKECGIYSGIFVCALWPNALWCSFRDRACSETLICALLRGRSKCPAKALRWMRRLAGRAVPKCCDLALCPCQGDDTDGGGAGTKQSACALSCGGAGGVDIVDEKNLLSEDLLWPRNLEGSTKVDGALAQGKGELTSGIPSAAQKGGLELQVCRLPISAKVGEGVGGEQFALVEGTFALVERDRDDEDCAVDRDIDLRRGRANGLGEVTAQGGCE